MRPFLEPFFITGLGTEILYSFIIIACSLLVYFSTKELYELSSYKGIKYFRLSFLFFAIAYFFRSFIKFVLVFFNVRAIHEFSPNIFMPMGSLTLVLFMYFSSMALFYLLYSVMWKKWNGNSKKIYLLHAIAIVISLLTAISGEPSFLLLINLFFFVLVSFIFYIAHKNFKDKKKGNTLYAIYMLLFVFWMLNLIDILVPSFLQGFQLFIYLASSGIFLAILYKVLKKTGN